MLQNCSIWKVLRVFFDDPDPEGMGLSLSEISRRSNLAHTSVKNYLEKLEEENILEVREKEVGDRVFPLYSLLRRDEQFKHYKVVDILTRIRESGLIEFLVGEAMPDCVVLFGSAARGEDTRNSDVDLYLQCEERDLELSRFEDVLKRRIEVRFNPEFSSYPKELKNNIANGIVIHGYLEACGDQVG